MEVPAHLTGSRRSLWLWLFQRISGIALIVLLLVHMVVLHYVDPYQTVKILGLTSEGVTLRMQAFLFIIVDNLLLAFVLFHAFNGVRNVAYDYVNSDRWRRVVAALCLVAGVALLVLALVAFIPMTLEGP
jgi:succinate dehydrogenase / fumarate reductase membrane anchor subunit